MAAAARWFRKDDDIAKDADERWTRGLPGGLRLRATDRPDSPLLEQFMAGYDRAFVLPDEREEIAGFRACLTINPRFRHSFGRTHREMVLVIEDTATGGLLGGANFLATRIDHAPRGHPQVAVALNYLFVEAAARGRGLSRALTLAVETVAQAAVDGLPGALPPALFIELNDPLRLTPADYATDSAHAGIDQIARVEVWARLGAELVDFPYVQPALSAAQDSDDGLAYAVMNFPGKAIDPRWFAGHLQSFFAISVLKGQDPAADEVAGPQLAALTALAEQGRMVLLLPLQPAVDRLRGLHKRPKGITLLAFARTVGDGTGDRGNPHGQETSD